MARPGTWFGRTGPSAPLAVVVASVTAAPPAFPRRCCGAGACPCEGRGGTQTPVNAQVRRPLQVDNQDPHGAVTHVVHLSGFQVAVVGVDPVARQAARFQSSGVKERPGRVEAECPGNWLGGRLSQRSQAPIRGIQGETGDAVVPPVGRVEELPRRRDLDLGAGIVPGVSIRQR